jgi:hypothetical protein
MVDEPLLVVEPLELEELSPSGVTAIQVTDSASS